MQIGTTCFTMSSFRGGGSHPAGAVMLWEKHWVWKFLWGQHGLSLHCELCDKLIIIIIIRNLYSAIMPLGYRGAGGYRGAKFAGYV